MEKRPRQKSRKPGGAYARRIGTGIGRGVKVVGRGIYETGAGFAEGAGLRKIKISPRGVGRVVGYGTKEVVKTAARVEFKPPEYFWGKPGEGVRPKVTPSKLPIEVQHAMVSMLGEMYPEIYKTLWEPGIRMSEFVGRIHAYHPDVYEDLRHLTYSKLMPQQRTIPYGYPQTGYPPGYPPGGYPGLTMY